MTSKYTLLTSKQVRAVHLWLHDQLMLTILQRQLLIGCNKSVFIYGLDEAYYSHRSWSPVTVAPTLLVRHCLQKIFGKVCQEYKMSSL